MGGKVQRSRKCGDLIHSSRNLFVLISLLPVSSFDLPHLVNTRRKVLKPYTFSDGIKVPAGETLAVPSRAVHLDDNVYKDANMFDGFRFYKLRESEEEGPAHSTSCVSTSTEYL